MATPMQKQHNQFKSEYPDALLLFRLGDFYEVFDEDAHTAAKVLGITLTARGKGENRHEMAGIPHHALRNYLPKLVEAGIKVAIADQIEDPVPGKLVKRAVTRVITPGTITDEESLQESKNNYIACVYTVTASDRNQYFLVFADLTTGVFKGFSTDNALILKNECNKLQASEVLLLDTQQEALSALINGFTQTLDEGSFESKGAYQLLTEQFKTKSLLGFGIEDNDKIVVPAAALLRYLAHAQKRALQHITSFEQYRYSDYMQLDETTIRNLELLYPMQANGSSSATLFAVLNKCMTSMGKRLLRSYIVNPLVNTQILEDRLDSVEFFFTNVPALDTVRTALKEVYDIERIAGKIGLSTAHPKDVRTLSMSLQNIISIISHVHEYTLPRRVQFITSDINTGVLNNLITEVEQTISEDPPVSITEGGIMAAGFNEEVDSLRDLKTNAKKLLAEMQQRTIAETGIPSLKISFNKVFGYYIEVTKTHLDKVPDTFIRKQTLANAERYITPELKDLEERILSSDEKLMQLEHDLFIEFRNKLVESVDMIKTVAMRIAEIDVITNFAYIARQYRYIKPELSSKTHDLNIEDGRHPVVEQLTPEFIPNSTTFAQNSYIHILTGPNMSGKSTYIRQTALLVLMAQIGSFVPANSMTFTPFNRIFTRVGASDNLSKGESTFMVEMTETANILNNATEHSLIILDEVGRGTSTYDGVAIAWSIIDYIHNHVKARTLFATHYHELIELEDTFDGIVNYNVHVHDTDGQITFTHKIERGGTNQSYGVHVAEIAGVPKDVVERANEILEKFEGSPEATKEKVDKEVSSEAKGLESGVEGRGKVEGKQKAQKKAAKKSPKKPRNIHPNQLGLI